MVQEMNSISLQAANHHSLPYSSLYGRINKLKRDNPADWAGFTGDLSLDAFMAASAGGGNGGSAAADSAAFSLPTLLERDGTRKKLEDAAGTTSATAGGGGGAKKTAQIAT